MYICENLSFVLGGYYIYGSFHQKLYSGEEFCSPDQQWKVKNIGNNSVILNQRTQKIDGHMNASYSHFSEKQGHLSWGGYTFKIKRRFPWIFFSSKYLEITGAYQLWIED